MTAVAGDADQRREGRPANRTSGGAATERRLLDTAARLFRQHGYQGTSTRDLATAIDVRPSTLYHYISGKERLLFEICEASLTEMLDVVPAAVAQGADPGDRMRRLIVTHMETILEARDLHATMLTELRSLSGPDRERVVELRDAYEEFVRTTIRDAQQAGVLRPDIDAKHLCLLLLNLLNWSIFWYVPGLGLPSRDLGEMAVTMFLDGAGASSATASAAAVARPPATRKARSS